MKKIIILALVLMSAKLLAIEFPKDTLWRKMVAYPAQVNGFLFSSDETKTYMNTIKGVTIFDSQKGDSLDFIGEINIGRESSDGSYFVSVNPTDISIKENNVEKYDSKTKQKIWTCPKRDKDNLLFVAFSQNAKYALLIYSGSNLDIYNVETQEFVKSLHYNTFTFNYKGFAIDNYGEKIIITAPITRNGKFGEVSYLIEVSTNKYLKEMYFAEGIQTEQSAMFSAQNNYALAKWQDYISVLDLRTMDSFVYTPSGGGGYDSRVGIISNDERLIVSGGSKKGSLEIFEIKNRKVIYTGENISEFSGSAFGEISKSNNLLLMFSYYGVFMIDLNKSWTDVPMANYDQIKISPNPVTSSIKIYNPNKAAIKNITAYSSVGNAFILNQQNNEINITHLPMGAYYLKITIENNVVFNFNFIKE